MLFARLLSSSSANVELGKLCQTQGVKLANELSNRDTGRALCVLDEPTTDLHFPDIALKLKVLHPLSDAGNTIVVIAHNLCDIKTEDRLIDMGPEGGEGGGTVVGVGTPVQRVALPGSHTGRFYSVSWAERWPGGCVPSCWLGLCRPPSYAAFPRPWPTSCHSRHATLAEGGIALI